MNQQAPTANVHIARIRLRPLAGSDESLYLELYTDAETMRYVTTPLSMDEAARSFRAALTTKPDAQQPTRYTVAVDASGAAIGLCAATFGIPQTGAAEVGIMLGRQARGRGLAHEVLGRFIDFVFEHHAVSMVWVRYAPEQAAVVRLNQGLGFVVSNTPLNDQNGRQSASIRRDAWRGFASSINRG